MQMDLYHKLLKANMTGKTLIQFSAVTKYMYMLHVFNASDTNQNFIAHQITKARYQPHSWKWKINRGLTHMDLNLPRKVLPLLYHNCLRSDKYLNIISKKPLFNWQLWSHTLNVKSLRQRNSVLAWQMLSY